ncbi:hypothetical protein [Natronococcus wangiae]|uniref:hypothetical protein n=1 Tax=Natronococcus wangiae TaxID=3068275 RepID=UPI00273EA562|nr:hypothetical protein [Natronococcus sp. AD5]
MSFQTFNREPETARQTLVEATGSPFTLGPEVRPVIDVIDGRKANNDLELADWVRALEAGDGAIAVYFELAADHEWWLAYDPDAEADDDLEGPFQRWTTYPSGG